MWQELYSPDNRLQSLAVGRNADGRLEVFGVSPDNRIFHTWQVAPNDSWNGEWKELYSPANRLRSLEVGRNADGRLEVFGVSPDNRIFHTWQVAPNDGWNGRWQELYSSADQLRELRVASNQDGRLEVFGVSPANRIFQTWQVAPNDGWNGRWQELYSSADQLRTLRVASNQDGRLEVFGLTPNNRVFQTWQVAPNDGWVGRWEALYSDANRLRTLDVGRNADGRLEVFGISSLTDRVFHTWQVAPNDGWNGRWQELYSPDDQLRELRVASNQDGRLEVFGISPAARVFQTWQVAPNDGWNGEWQELGNNIRILIKIVTNPNVAIATMLENMRTVFATAGIGVVEEGPRENLTIVPTPGAPAQTVFDMGPCTRGQAASADQTLLFGNRNNALSNDIVLYFVTTVNSNSGPLNGCAGPAARQPAAVIAQGASPWTMAHEVGHVLGLTHITGENTGCPSFNPLCCSTPDFTRLMTGCGTNGITGTPTLAQGEINTMQGNNLSQHPQLRALEVAQNADGRLEVFGVGLDNRIWQTWQVAPNNGWN